jgi:hypothetical protein
MLKKLVVDAPEARDVLSAAGPSAPVVSDMQSENISREPIAVEIHSGRDLGSREPYVSGPSWDGLFGGIANVACRVISLVK